MGSSDPPCRMTAGIGIISALQKDESDPEAGSKRVTQLTLVAG